MDAQSVYFIAGNSYAHAYTYALKVSPIVFLVSVSTRGRIVELISLGREPV